MNKHILSVLFVASFFFLFSQPSKIDSLKTELVTAKSDTIKANIIEDIAREVFYTDIKYYNRLCDSMIYYAVKSGSVPHIGHSYNLKGRYYQQTSDVDSAAFFYRKAKFIYQKENLSTDLAIALGNLGGLFMNAAITDSSRLYLNEAIKINNKISSYEGLFFNYYNLAILEDTNSKPNMSLTYMIEALKNAEKISNTRYITYCQSYLGVLYMDQNIFDTAEKYFYDCIKNFQKIDDYGGIGNQFLNLAVIYSERDRDYLKAIEAYKMAIFNYNKVENLRETSTALANIGKNYLKLSVLDSAKTYLHKANLLAKKTKQKLESSRITAALAEVSYKEKNYLEAKQYVLSAIESMNQNEVLRDKGDALLLLSDVNSKLGNYKTAYENLYESKQLLDSITSTEKLKQIATIETKYQTEKKEKENLQLKADKAEQQLIIAKNQNQKYIFAGMAGLLGFGLICFVLHVRKRKRDLETRMKFSVARARQEQNNVLAKDLHDLKALELKGVELQLEKGGQNEVAKRVKSIREDIRDISHKISRVSFDKSEFNEQLVSLVSTYNKENFTIRVSGLDTISWVSILDVVKENLFIVIREAIDNAHDHPSVTMVNVVFKKEKKYLRVSVTDNGTGIEDNHPRGLGLNNIEMRIKEINGKFSIKNAGYKGTTLHFDILLT